MLATGLTALSFHNPRAEREFEYEEEFELTVKGRLGYTPPY